MSDLLATMERLREAQELERLRAEVAELRRRLATLGAKYASLNTVYNQKLMTEFQMMMAKVQKNGAEAELCNTILSIYGERFGPSPPSKHTQAERFRLFGF